MTNEKCPECGPHGNTGWIDLAISRAPCSLCGPGSDATETIAPRTTPESVDLRVGSVSAEQATQVVPARSTCAACVKLADAGLPTCRFRCPAHGGYTPSKTERKILEQHGITTSYEQRPLNANHVSVNRRGEAPPEQRTPDMQNVLCVAWAGDCAACSTLDAAGFPTSRAYCPEHGGYTPSEAERKILQQHGIYQHGKEWAVRGLARTPEQRMDAMVKEHRRGWALMFDAHVHGGKSESGSPISSIELNVLLGGERSTIPLMQLRAEIKEAIDGVLNKRLSDEPARVDLCRDATRGICNHENVLPEAPRDGRPTGEILAEVEQTIGRLDREAKSDREVMLDELEAWAERMEQTHGMVEWCGKDGHVRRGAPLQYRGFCSWMSTYELAELVNARADETSSVAAIARSILDREVMLITESPAQTRELIDRVLDQGKTPVLCVTHAASVSTFRHTFNIRCVTAERLRAEPPSDQYRVIFTKSAARSFGGSDA